MNNKTNPRQYGRPPTPQHTSLSGVSWTTPSKMPPLGKRRVCRPTAETTNLKYRLETEFDLPHASTLVSLRRRISGQQNSPHPPRAVDQALTLYPRKDKNSHRNKYRNSERNFVGPPPPPNLNPPHNSQSSESATSLNWSRSGRLSSTCDVY